MHKISRRTILMPYQLGKLQLQFPKHWHYPSEIDTSLDPSKLYHHLHLQIFQNCRECHFYPLSKLFRRQPNTKIHFENFFFRIPFPAILVDCGHILRNICETWDTIDTATKTIILLLFQAVTSICLKFCDANLYIISGQFEYISV